MEILKHKGKQGCGVSILLKNTVQWWKIETIMELGTPKQWNAQKTIAAY